MNSLHKATGHHLVTKSKVGVYKPKYPFVGVKIQDLQVATEAITVKEALAIPHWIRVMTEDYNALMRNKTWTLVPYDGQQNIVDCKLVYRRVAWINLYCLKLVFSLRKLLFYGAIISVLMHLLQSLCVMHVPSTQKWMCALYSRASLQ